MNIHIYRYADMLCSWPRRKLNQSATVDSLTTPWAVYRIELYATPWIDQVFARTAVRFERRLELAMEGQRFFDLRR